MSAEQRALLRLINWLSPSLPTGGYSYSHGLEMAVAEGHVADREGLQNWLGDILTLGSGWNDAVMLAETWRTAGRHGDCRPLARLAEAMCLAMRRRQESRGTHMRSDFPEETGEWQRKQAVRLNGAGLEIHDIALGDQPVAATL